MHAKTIWKTRSRGKKHVEEELSDTYDMDFWPHIIALSLLFARI